MYSWSKLLNCPRLQLSLPLALHNLTSHWRSLVLWSFSTLPPLHQHCHYHHYSTHYHRKTAVFCSSTSKKKIYLRTLSLRFTSDFLHHTVHGHQVLFKHSNHCLQSIVLPRHILGHNTLHITHQTIARATLGTGRLNTHLSHQLIEATLDGKKGVLECTGKIFYINRSLKWEHNLVRIIHD